MLIHLDGFLERRFKCVFREQANIWAHLQADLVSVAEREKITPHQLSIGGKPTDIFANHFARRIHLPSALAKNFSYEEIKFIACHELAHLKYIGLAKMRSSLTWAQGGLVLGSVARFGYGLATHEDKTSLFEDMIMLTGSGLVLNITNHLLSRYNEILCDRFGADQTSPKFGLDVFKKYDHYIREHTKPLKQKVLKAVKIATSPQPNITRTNHAVKIAKGLTKIAVDAAGYNSHPSMKIRYYFLSKARHLTGIPLMAKIIQMETKEAVATILNLTLQRLLRRA